jgi:hypothetical protein
MRSKAQDIRQQEWLSKHDRPPQNRRAKPSDGADTARPTVSASDKKHPRTHEGLQNEKKGIQPGAVLEENHGKTSRKSTRKSADHTKRTSNLQNKATMASRSPKARHARNAAKAKAKR